MASWFYLVGFLLMVVAVVWFCWQGIVSVRRMQKDVHLMRLYLQVGSDVRGASLPHSIWEQIHALQWKVKHFIDERDARAGGQR
jgi:hypothetical protein